MFFANRFVKKIQEKSPTPIDSKEFNQVSCIFAEDKICEMSPKQVNSLFEMFGDEEMRRRLMQATIAGLRDHRMDIGKFNVEQLSDLISLVAQYSPADLHVFYKYSEQAAAAGMFAEDFVPLANLFCLFVDQGFLTE